jgi:ligand-binding sensor domain-containing protein
LYEDQSGNIWFPIENAGVYRYDPSTEVFTNFHKEEGLLLNAVHTIREDQAGRLWVGGFGGLYRYDTASGQFVNMTREGAWGDIEPQK